MSRLRRPLLPVTGLSFKTSKVASRSWPQQAREFDVKPAFSRVQPQLMRTAEATLPMKTSFTSAAHPVNEWTPTPIFCLWITPFAALRAAAAAVGQAQESRSQAVNDSRISCSAAGAGHARSGGRILESPGGTAPRSWSRRPTRARRSTRRLRSTREQRQVHGRPSARVGAMCEHGYAQGVYRRDVWDVIYRMYRACLSSCVSWL